MRKLISPDQENLITEKIIVVEPKLEKVLATTRITIEDNEAFVENPYPTYLTKISENLEFISSVIKEVLGIDNILIEEYGDSPHLRINFNERISDYYIEFRTIPIEDRNNIINIPNKEYIRVRQSIDIITNSIIQYLNDFNIKAIEEMNWKFFDYALITNSPTYKEFEMDFISNGNQSLVKQIKCFLRIRRIGDNQLDISINNKFDNSKSINLMYSFVYKVYDQMQKWEKFELNVNKSTTYKINEIIGIYNKIWEYINNRLMEDNLLQDKEYIEKKILDNNLFIDRELIDQIRNIKSEKFDFTKLISLCNELNINYLNKCYYSVTLLIRAIIDHIPPIFELTSFERFVNEYKSVNSSKNSSKDSFKDAMKHLNNILRNVANIHIHEMINKKHVDPSQGLIDFRSPLALLLSEIIKKMSKI